MDKAVIGILESGTQLYDKYAGSIMKGGLGVQRLSPALDFSSELATRRCDVWLVTDPLRNARAIDVLNSLKKNGVDVPIVFVAADASVREAVEALHGGANDYLLISDDPDLLMKRIEHILRVNEKQPQATQDGTACPRIISACPAMVQLLEMSRRIAPSAATVLIQGESGTGKELLARYIHTHSGRAKYGFLAMNCAALPDTLAESELFGYERGAFTGAVQRKPGKFELAHQGTLLLDEISEMPLALQAKLLRVLQEKEVDRLGGQKAVPVDVRVVATTNRDLGQMVQQGKFRKDLYYRLRVVPIIIPPLRDRQPDLPLLIEYFLKKHTAPGEPPLFFNHAAMEKMQQWPWPGNVRELENTIERAALIRTGSQIGPELLLLDETPQNEDYAKTAELVGLTVRELEERLIIQTLRHVNHNRTHAAEMLGISIRTLRNKLREYREGEDLLPEAAEG
ncbi:MAG: sigma-54 dependent transcriptional regulator [Desulfobacteraceae bacterium]|nr:sigma-54 dependent transcriptional regulator [Desulfobacteraceae bacterium]